MSESNDLLEGLRVLYEGLRADTNRRWRRDLPLEELLFDRWQRAANLGFGDGSSIYHNSYVYGDVQVGKHTWIGPYTLLDGTGGLTIGDYCSISAGVQIYTHDTVRWALSGGKEETERAPVKIGNNCYVGAQSAVIKDVTIGDHSVIGACSFVNRDVPPYTIAFGVPCRPMGHVEFDSSGKVILVQHRVRDQNL